MPPWRNALLAAAIALAALAGCARHHSTMDDRMTHSYLALGDSYTIGEGVAHEGRWPVQLAHALREQGIALDDPRIIATTGWTTDELMAAVNAAEPLGQWDFVTLLIGVNNQYRGRSVADYRGEFTEVLDRAVKLAHGNESRVVVVSIPDWGVTPFAVKQARDPGRIAAELDAYNAVAREICAARGIAFVDITPVSRKRGAEPVMLVEDGLHPSGAMYALWTQQVAPVAQRLLAP
ncbi:MAG: Lysophospholipase L1 and related esterases [uncultured Lysobacter sp.]|uniref:Lysophospholipase L1 and related esterases n=1 Tax=uncultured Lysobacter sp. TaxID=271060 RepID=A0A6J4KZL3_9GAMM|nr:MAG: Lysophospholipase L1 and related esterases [uncultured Lysobacter sp.]